MANCGVCNDVINRKPLVCTVCGNTFHSFCVVDKPIHWDSWKCSNCKKLPESNNTESNSNININDAISALQQELAAIKSKQEKFFSAISIIDEVKSKHEDFLNSLNTFNSHCETVKNMDNRVLLLEKKVSILEKDNVKLKENINFLHHRFAAIEHHAYASNIEIKGIPQVNNENLFNVIDIIAKKINIDCTVNDIKHIHRTISKKKLNRLL